MNRATMISSTDRWPVVERRERDASFVYAVVTTGIYCRPSCPSRRPKRENVRFFDDCASAERAGFRPCLRCDPTRVEPRAGLVADVCRFLEANADRRVSLGEASKFAGLSPFHLQRTFRAELGVSPREYQAALRRRESAPGDVVTYALADSPLGRMILAETKEGICAVSFGDDDAALCAWLRSQMPYAELREGRLAIPVETVLRAMETGSSRDIPLDVRGTAFQQKVWNTLRAIPAGSTRTYEELAEAIGQPSAVRAAAHACASNRIAILIPCHRIVRKDGALGGYRWGLERKKALLEREKGI